MIGTMRAMLLATAATMLAGAAQAQEDGYYKGKVITLAVGGTAGGGIDIARAWCRAFWARTSPASRRSTSR